MVQLGARGKDKSSVDIVPEFSFSDKGFCGSNLKVYNVLRKLMFKCWEVEKLASMAIIV